jgi:outer membrane immunogenic protein
MKKFLAASVSMFVISSAAFAADATYQADSSWSGGYVGIIGGYGWGEANLDGTAYLAGTSTALPSSVSESFDLTGGLVGGQAGYDFDLGNNFVLGVVGDMSWSGVGGDVCVETTQGGCVVSDPSDSYFSADLSWLGTLRARGGFATGDMLFYLTGGLALGEVETSITNVGGQNDPTREDSNTHVGWTVGGGAEFKVNESVSIGAEYLYVNLGSQDYEYNASNIGSPPADIRGEGDLTLSLVRASLNFRF